MALQHHGKLRDNYQAKTVTFLKQLQDLLNLSNEEISDIIGISTNRYKSFLNYSASPKAHELQRLLDKYSLSFDALKNDKIDINLLSLHQKGSLDNISKKYSIGAFSKRRTIKHTLNYLKNRIGHFSYDMTERYFQMNKYILAKPDEYINIHFIEDLYDYLATQQKLTMNDFFQMGQHNLLTLQGSHFVKALTEVSHPKFLYRNLIERDVLFLEKNSHYDLLTLTNDTCIFRSNIRQEVSDILKISKVGTPHTCKYREGIFAILPQFLDLAHAHVIETSCVHRGDTYCQFEVDFSQASFQHELNKSKLPSFSQNLFQ